MIIYNIDNYARRFDMERKQERKVENCPFCEVPVIFRKYSDFSTHLESCPLLDSQQELLTNKEVRGSQQRGPLMTRAYQKILGFRHANVVNANRKKFAEEWKRTDDFWKEEMIVCPECFSFKIPADEKIWPCPDCKCMMEWAKELIEIDPRFNFVREFCLGD